MSTTLFAFDSIAPMIGGVVLTGAFSFFGGVLLGRKGWEDPDQNVGKNLISETASAATASPSPQPIAAPLDARSTDLLFQQKDACASFSSFLRWIVPHPSAGFAAIVGLGTKERFATIAVGLSKLSIEHLMIPDKLLQRLKLESSLIVESEAEAAMILRWLDEIDRGKVQQLCLTALDDGHGIVAVLIASSPWPAGLGRMEQRALMNLAAQTVGHRWHQMLALQKQSHELRSTRDMLELRAIIDAQLDDPIETLSQFATRLCEMVSADRIAIYFVARRAGEQLQPIVECGRDLPPAVEADWKLHERAVAKIAIESEVGQLRDGDWLQHLRAGSPITSSVSMPIQINGRILGAVCLTSHAPYGNLESRRTIVEFATEILSQTLRRIFDEATIRRQARHDHLTDLVNRRSLDAYLVAEIERIKNGDSPTCSLILADLDHFKSVNDRFGHLGGDHVLRETARVLSEQVSRLRTGEHSIVARYGGEEFAILLPDVGLQGALRIAEGIRAAIESEQIHIQDVIKKVTLSLGVAVCPDQANSVTSLIAAADKALYQAKSSGRNRVCRANAIADESYLISRD